MSVCLSDASLYYKVVSSLSVSISKNTSAFIMREASITSNTEIESIEGNKRVVRDVTVTLLL